MNKMDLVAAVAEETDLPRGKVGEIVDAVFASIEKGLKSNGEVRLTGFGTFVTSSRGPAKGRHPQTGAEIDIPASTSVRFKAGKGLKEAVN